MRLRLPKLLLQTILAAYTVSTAWAGWDSGSTNTYYYTGSTDTALNTEDGTPDPKLNNTFFLKPKGATSGTMETVTIDNGDTLIITGNWGKAGSEDNFSNLTINKIVGDAGETLEIGAHQNNEGTKVGTQVVNIKNGKETYSVEHTIVHAGATLNFSPTTDAINHNATMDMTVAGTVNFGTARQTVGNFTLNLNSGTILGSNNKSSTTGDKYGAIDFKGGITGKITSTGTSSITGGVRLRSNITIEVTDGELTIDALVKDGGITKTGTGTLTLTLANSYNEGLYAGNTILKDGGTIKYAVKGDNHKYTGTISGVGNIAKTDTGKMTLTNVSNLDGDISVSGGTLEITTLNVDKTLDVSVAQGAALNLGTVNISNNHKLDRIDAESFYTHDGTNASTNGFILQNVDYLLFDNYEWKGSTIAGYSLKYQDGDTILSGQTVGTIFYVREGELSISTAGDYIKNRAERYEISKNASLIVDAASGSLTPGKIITTSTGEGNLLLKGTEENALTATLKAGSASALTGNLTIQNATLEVDRTGDHNSIKTKVTSLSSFTSVTLDNAIIKYVGATTSLQNVTVTENGAYLMFNDLGDKEDQYQLLGTTLLNGDLTINKFVNDEGKAWKYNVYISDLTGDGNISFTNATEAGKLTIDKLSSYNGAITMTRSSTSSNLVLNSSSDQTLSELTLVNGATLIIGDNATSHTTTIKKLNIDGSGSINSNGATVDLTEVALSGDDTLNFENAATIEKLTIEGSAMLSTKNGNVTLTDVILTDGDTLRLMYWTPSNETTITKLTVSGAATLGTERSGSCHNGTITLNNLKSEGEGAVLTLVNGSKTTNTTTYNIDGGDFDGTINIKGDVASGGDRPLAVNLKHATAAADAVICFLDATEEAAQAQNKITFGVGCEDAQIAGFHGDTVTPATIKSTAQEEERSLKLNVAEGKELSTNATVESSVKLVKSGKGKQTFTGKVESTDISVELGELVLELGELVLAEQRQQELKRLQVSAKGIFSVYYKDDEENILGTVIVGNSVLTVEEAATTGYSAIFAGGATINANLKLINALTLELNDMNESVKVSGDLAMAEGTVTLGGNILNALSTLTKDTTLKLFSINGTLTIGDTVISKLSREDAMQLSTLFTNKDLDNYYLGFENNELYVGLIPEPTTTTLSLLALAALAARRRRK